MIFCLGAVQTPQTRREDVVGTQSRLHTLRGVSVQTPPPTAAFSRRSYASPPHAHGVLVALQETSLRCYCVAAANPRLSHGTHSERRGNTEPRRSLCACTKCAPWHGVLGDPMASTGDATAIPRRSRRSHCAHLGILSFSCTPCSRREDAILVWQRLYIRTWHHCIHFHTYIAT